MLVRDGKILLAMKKRGFGVGFWNGYGGKLYDGETARIGAVREIAEESGLRVDPTDLIELGTIDFHFTDKPESDQQGIIYTNFNI